MRIPALRFDLWLSLVLVMCGTALGAPERPEFQAPRWFVTLRVPPGPASRGAAFTIPVEVDEFQPSDITVADEIKHLLPQPASPDQPAPYTWDFAHGLGMLLRPENPVPVKTYLLRPERLSGPSVRAMIGAASPKLRADADFQKKLKYLGVAVFGMKDSGDLSAVFPGVPLAGGITKLGDKLEQLHFATSFPYIPVEAVTAAKPANVTAESTYKLEGVDPVFAKALAADGIGSVSGVSKVDGVAFAQDALDTALNLGVGNADDKNHKRALKQIKFDLGYIPRGDVELGNVTGNTTSAADIAGSVRYQLWKTAGADGVVDFRGWTQINKFVAPVRGTDFGNQMEIFMPLVACTDQAELRAELMYQTFKAWRLQQIVNTDNHAETAKDYALVQTLMRINEPLWDFLTLRRVLGHCGPRLKVLGDELVPQLDPLSTKIWQDRYTRAESMVNALETVHAAFKESPAGEDDDSFFPLCDDQIAYEVNRAWFTAMRFDVKGTTDTTISIPKIGSLTVAGSPDKVHELHTKLTKRLLGLVAKGFTRDVRPLPLTGVLAKHQEGRGTQLGDPKLEPDLVWLARACQGIKPRTATNVTSFEFENGDGVNGFVRPFIIMSQSTFGVHLRELVANNVLGCRFQKDINNVFNTVSLPKDTYFKYADRPEDIKQLCSVLSSMRTVCKPEFISERVRTSQSGKTAGWSETWFDTTFKSEAGTKPATATDTETMHWMRLRTLLDAELTKVGQKQTTVTAQYFHFKKGATDADGLVFAGVGTESAASAAVRQAVQLNLELIGRLYPPQLDDTRDLAVQRAEAKTSFIEQAMLRQALRPGDELMLDLWETVLTDNRLPITPPATRFRTKAKALATAAGVTCVIFKRNSGQIAEETL